ncbi:MAG: SDR family oxidoreductase [SAR202 cluster bacterium]|jgi:NADP-dependent 3-hydroxy acid dehydrogenase YdfG|nr:MAG: SDR family oxidoreductase [SAR202 cluster bacterium]KAA1298660.1 MAG: SDR family oxidoreductase [SAR202 cluster bacterium]|tara:strand:+ start:3882 stop:4664 length:783 start_codon:yes stop_codon:yes gene_type:complete
MKMDSLKGKSVILTGAGSGIGRVTAKMLGELGANVFVVGRRENLLKESVKEIEAAGGKGAYLSADLEDGDSAANVAKEAIKAFGNIQYLVNNAGHSSKVRSMRYVEKDDWQSVFNVNVEGVYRLTQAILPNMIENGGGTVVTISSMAAINPGLMGGVPYSSAKAAVAAMMTAMRQELREHGIRSCTIYPAEVDTPILDNRPLPPDEQARSTMMQPEDIAETILLCMRMPHRTIIQDLIVSPTIQRDVSEDMKIAKTLGSK